MRAAFVLAATLGATTACSPGAGETSGDGSANDGFASDSTVEEGADPYPGADSPPGIDVVYTYAPTYDAVWSEILVPRCANEFCHGGSADFLQLASQAIGYQSLVNMPAQGPDCVDSGLKRVAPYEPDASLMYLKITSPPCGNKMPFNYGPPVILEPRQIDQVRAWIACGALDGEAGCPGEAGSEAGSEAGEADAADAGSSDAVTDALPD
jgi:hypothetical protein